MKTTGIILIALAMLIALTGVVMADQVIPAFGNIVQSGSTYDLTIGSVVSTADHRLVGTDATKPVFLNYGITVKPYTIAGSGTSPAMGSVSAYIKGSIKEGRSGYDYTGPIIPTGSTWSDLYNFMSYDLRNVTPSGPAGTFTYSESSSASGIINSFSKTMSYQSGRLLLP